MISMINEPNVRVFVFTRFERVPADEKYGRFFLSVNRENHALGCSQHREYVARRPFALAQTAWHKSHEFTSSVKKSKPIFIVVSGAVTYNKLNFYINVRLCM